MKTAEEFYRESDWSTYRSSIEAIQARDLEMWQQGMTDAAAMVISVAAYSPELKNIRDKIRIKRDTTKSV